MKFLVNDDGSGESWTLEEEWDFGDYPAAFRDKFGNFYLFYIEIIDYGEPTEVTNLYMLKKPVETGVWQETGTLILSDICYGDIGVTYNSAIGDNGRIIITLWKTKITPIVYYSDDLGSNWTEVTA